MQLALKNTSRHLIEQIKTGKVNKKCSWVYVTTSFSNTKTKRTNVIGMSLFVKEIRKSFYNNIIPFCKKTRLKQKVLWMTKPTPDYHPIHHKMRRCVVENFNS